jgi:hypothetical protein
MLFGKISAHQAIAHTARASCEMSASSFHPADLAKDYQEALGVPTRPTDANGQLRRFRRRPATLRHTDSSPTASHIVCGKRFASLGDSSTASCRMWYKILFGYGCLGKHNSMMMESKNDLHASLRPAQSKAISGSPGSVFSTALK